jgi:hypothetical protein
VVVAAAESDCVGVRRNDGGLRVSFVLSAKQRQRQRRDVNDDQSSIIRESTRESST